jgi:acyl-CoA thioester hydrolase
MTNDLQPAPLSTWRGAVLHEWVDYNGHLRDAFYLLIFSLASDALMEHIGLDEAGRQATGHSLFTLECHLNFLHEVKLDAKVEVRTQVLGHDSKRLQIYHSLHLADTPGVLAASEQMLVNVEVAGPVSAPFATGVLARLQALAARHQALAMPRFVGRTMTLPA